MEKKIIFLLTIWNFNYITQNKKVPHKIIKQVVIKKKIDNKNNIKLTPPKQKTPPKKKVTSQEVFQNVSNTLNKKNQEKNKKNNINVNKNQNIKNNIPVVINNNLLKKDNILEDNKENATNVNVNNSNNAIANNNIDVNKNNNIESNKNNNVENINNKKPLKINGNKSNLKNIIDNNNKEVILDLLEKDNEIVEDDDLKAYPLPGLDNDENNNVIESNSKEQINTEYKINKNLKETALNERSFANNLKPKFITPMNKGVKVTRDPKKDNSDNNYQDLLEDGRLIKRAFTIQEKTTVLKFLISNGISQERAEYFSNIIKKEHGLEVLNKGQYIVLQLKTFKQFFKKHKNNNNKSYDLKRLVIFFDNGLMMFKIKRGIFFPIKLFHDEIHKDFFMIKCSTVEDFVEKVLSLQPYCSQNEFNFFLQIINFLLNKIEKKKSTVNAIKVLCQQKIENNTIKKKIRGVVIITNETNYVVYLYKDFAGNFHLLNNKGNSFNLEKLDLNSNPPLNGMITSLFGKRYHPVLKKQKHHSGLDIAAEKYTPVFSTLNGWVLSAGYHKSYGNYIVISYSNTVHTLYGHLSKIFVKTGDYVESGQFIGAVGSTGRSSGNHLHYEIFKSDINFYTLDTQKINLLFSNRTILDPGLKYKISIGLRTPENVYFFNLMNQMNKALGNKENN